MSGGSDRDELINCTHVQRLDCGVVCYHMFNVRGIKQYCQRLKHCKGNKTLPLELVKDLFGLYGNDINGRALKGAHELAKLCLCFLGKVCGQRLQVCCCFGGGMDNLKRVSRQGSPAQGSSTHDSLYGIVW